MFKVITGKEALKRIADGEEVHYRLSSSMSWSILDSLAEWSVSDILKSERYVFAIKTEAMRIDFAVYIGVQTMPVDVSKFFGKRVRITVEEIEQ